MKANSKWAHARTSGCPDGRLFQSAPLLGEPTPERYGVISSKRSTESALNMQALCDLPISQLVHVDFEDDIHT